MRFRPFLRAVWLGLSVTALSFAAPADTAGAQAFVEREHSQIKRLVESNAPASAVSRAIDSMVDYTAVAQRALGHPCPTTIPKCTDHWSELSDAQKKEVVGLFKALVEKRYRENAYKTRNFDVKYRGTRDAGGGLARVRTEAKDRTKPREPAVQVDYIIRGNGPYKVVDLITEGSILSKNYYEQSHKMLTTPGQGYPYFVKKLRERINKR